MYTIPTSPLIPPLPSPTSEAMTALGHQLGTALSACAAQTLNGGRLILLEGDLGAGKTTFARGVIRALTHETEDVPSPSFSLVQHYNASPTELGWQIYHFDLYRLQRPEEIWELGIEDVLEEGLGLIEWPEKAIELLYPRYLEAALHIRILGNTERKLHFSTGDDTLWRELIEIAYKSSNETTGQIMTGASTRDRARRQFTEQAGWGDAQSTLLRADASTRRYMRLERPLATTSVPPPSAILMDAPEHSPETLLKEDISIQERWQKGYQAAARIAGSNLTAFSTISQTLCRHGLRAPEVFKTDLVNGFALIEDLGDNLYVHAMSEASLQGRPELIEQYYKAALEALAQLQAKITDSRQINGYHVAPYDETALMAEALLLPQWYAPFLTAAPLSEESIGAYKSAFREMFSQLSAPHTLVLRDFHTENLLWISHNSGLDRVGIIDFQDALIGHAAYDVVSLLEDARRDVPTALQEKLLRHFKTIKAESYPAFNEAQFDTDYAILAAQRNAKILGIFARLIHRDGKTKYQDFMPLVHRYFHTDLNRPETTPLKEWAVRHMPALLKNTAP